MLTLADTKQFAVLIDGSIFWSDDVFYTPVTIYAMWLIVYYLVEFIFTNDVRLCKIDAPFTAWISRWNLGSKRYVAVFGPISFLSYSFACWFAFHVVASRYLWDSLQSSIATVVCLFIWWINAGPTIL